MYRFLHKIGIGCLHAWLPFERKPRLSGFDVAKWGHILQYLDLKCVFFLYWMQNIYYNYIYIYIYIMII